MKKIFLLIFMFPLIFVMFACGETTDCFKINLDFETYTGQVGESVDIFKLDENLDLLKNKEVVVYFQNESIASFDENNIITFNNVGTTTVYIIASSYCDEYKASFNLIILDKSENKDNKEENNNSETEELINNNLPNENGDNLPNENGDNLHNENDENLSNENNDVLIEETKTNQDDDKSIEDFNNVLNIKNKMYDYEDEFLICYFEIYLANDAFCNFDYFIISGSDKIIEITRNFNSIFVVFCANTNIELKITNNLDNTFTIVEI